MNPKQLGASILAFVAFAVTIVAMATPAWFVWVGNTRTCTPAPCQMHHELHCGLKTYTYSTLFTVGASSVNVDKSETGKNADMTEQQEPWNNFGKQLDKGGNAIIGTGTTSLVLAVIGLVFAVLVWTGKRSTGYGVLVIALWLASAALLMVGLFLYSKQINAGYSFILFLIGTLTILAAAGLLAFSLIGEPSRLKQVAVLLMLVAGIALGCVAMGTTQWRVFSEEATDANGQPITPATTWFFEIGLATWTLGSQTGNTIVNTDGNLDDKFKKDYPWLADFVDAGKKMMGLGISGVLLAAIAVVLTGFVMSGKKGVFSVLSVVAALAGGILMLVGEILYAKQLYVGYSFMLFIAAFFVYMLAAAMLVVGLGEGPSTKSGNDFHKHEPIVATHDPQFLAKLAEPVHV